MTTVVEQHDPQQPLPAAPPFILYLDGAEYAEEMRALAVWVGDLLLPVYGREVTSQQPWCPRWWEHLEAVARLHALWLAWQELTDPTAGASGPGGLAPRPPRSRPGGTPLPRRTRSRAARRAPTARSNRRPWSRTGRRPESASPGTEDPSRGSAPLAPLP